MRTTRRAASASAQPCLAWGRQRDPPTRARAGRSPLLGRPLRTRGQSGVLLLPQPRSRSSPGRCAGAARLPPDRLGADSRPRRRLLRERASKDERPTPISLAELPPHVEAAFLAAEDHGFHHHLGVSPTAIVRAAKQNLTAGRVVAGGSTISMQLARTLVPRERTLFGKVQEALWALRLEAHLTKAQLLEQYLNRVPFGNNTWGLEAAAQLYFGRPAKNLSVAQAAALAAIPRGPTAYNPYQRPAHLAERQRWILGRMGHPEASGDALDLVPFESAFRAPHFVEYVADHLAQWGLADATEIVTTLDPELQLQVEDQIHEELGRLTERRVSSAAALVIDNATSEVLAYQGSADFFDAKILGQNDGVQMHRQPGSALKPFVYAEAFTRGFTPGHRDCRPRDPLRGAEGRLRRRRTTTGRRTARCACARRSPTATTCPRCASPTSWAPR
ncbi:MAG: transglycosylase domain-containing protein [Archangiaceae bacterium]|nr:transglycosylase domain-containing protein [Archangiaceae bacterium]